MNQMVQLVLLMSLLGCSQPSVRTVVRNPAPCQVSSYPILPSDINFSECISGVICFAPDELNKIIIWSEQIERWKKEVVSCPYIKQYNYENGILKVMESMQ